MPPKNQTERVIHRNIFVYVYMHTKMISGKIAMNVNESRKGYIGGF